VVGLALLVSASLSLWAAEPLGTNVVAQIRALMAEKESRTPAQQKKDSQLILRSSWRTTSGGSWRDASAKLVRFRTPMNVAGGP